MTDVDKVIEALKCRAEDTDYPCTICGYYKRDDEHAIPYCDFRGLLDDAIELLKEQKGLMLALEQSNAVNGYLNAEVERLNGLLKEQEEIINRYQWEDGEPK